LGGSIFPDNARSNDLPGWIGSYHRGMLTLWREPRPVPPPPPRGFRDYALVGVLLALTALEGGGPDAAALTRRP